MIDRTWNRRAFIGGVATVAAAALAGQRAGAAQAVDGEADLAAIKAYVVDQAKQMKEGTVALRQTAQAYYDLANAAAFDYAALWSERQGQLTEILANAKAQWLTASTHYELNEGLIAGVPSLSYYDVWIDAGPSAGEDPAGALDWTLELPDGTKLEKPGNFFHNLTEPAIWGTDEAFVGLRVDLNDDEESGLGESLPEANLFLGAAQGLDEATAEMQQAIDQWQPTLEDAFAALVTMIPTMSEYFEQWKNSAYVAGEASTEAAFVATSRLFDVNGIIHGLDLTYDEIGVTVETVDASLHKLIETGFDDLVGFVEDLYAQEQAGTRFAAEEAELYGSEAQERATRLVGRVSQAVALLGLQV
ncbi:MAG: EfeM/EfeO family lipoprotein [Thermomicrobiales bacterium]